MVSPKFGYSVLDTRRSVMKEFDLQKGRLESLKQDLNDDRLRIERALEDVAKLVRG